MASTELDPFIEDILRDKKLPAIDDAVRTQLVSDLKDRLLDQIDRAIIEALPEARIDGLNELLDREASEAEVHEYVAASGVDVKRVTVTAMLQFRDFYLRSHEERSGR
ncbi:hypothetical protein A2791_05040 [Candidatus Saccharibacteria bacterium RIFCSPHIGHO2_01_FULL_46_30]|nr:MAG: hypothetical protein A2791_05040 [Candidatus Saccharibacteria bacterium RIFCSPHIGHO2_01_FULL_46_30]